MNSEIWKHVGAFLHEPSSVSHHRLADIHASLAGRDRYPEKAERERQAVVGAVAASAAVDHRLVRGQRRRQIADRGRGGWRKVRARWDLSHRGHKLRRQARGRLVIRTHTGLAGLGSGFHRGERKCDQVSIPPHSCGKLSLDLRTIAWQEPTEVPDLAEVSDNDHIDGHTVGVGYAVQKG